VTSFDLLHFRGKIAEGFKFLSTLEVNKGFI
jgi:hypothetical protein